MVSWEATSRAGANGSWCEKLFRGDGLKAGMINVCDFSRVVEMINQDGKGKQGVNSEVSLWGWCAGRPGWAGWPLTPRHRLAEGPGEDEEGT